MNEEQLKFLSPDIIISFGGAPVSAKFKKFLRRCNSAIHWHVGKSDNAIDCFRKLTARIELNPEGFFPRFASSLAHISRNSEKKGDYAEIWKRYVQSVTVSSGVKKQLPPMQFNAMSAVDYILQSMPSNWNIQLGNGMAVRYGLVSDHLCRFHRVDSNRGVSGIDGCLSTAIGASCAYSGNTLLIIGDMSTEYDLSAFFSGLITQKLKIVVLNNGGGGIFHYVNTTRNLPELDQYFVCKRMLPLNDIAEAYGFRFLRASSMPELAAAADILRNETTKPVCIEVVTDPTVDTDVFKAFTDR